MKVLAVSAIVGGSVALGATLALPAAGEYELLLSGPAESVDHATNTVTVLGHRIVVRDASRFFPGQKFNVLGVISRSGSSSARVVVGTNTYSAGGDAVSVAGKVTAIDAARGRINVEGALVDYTALLARPGFSLPALGAAIRAKGTQPAGRGVVLANEFVSIAGVSGNSQAVGVSGNSQAAGVSGNSQAVGVSGNSQAAGVSGNSQAVGVSGNSFLARAMGVSGNSQAAGVSGNSQAVGVSGNSFLARAMGVSGNSQAAGVSGNSQAAGVSGNSQAVGVSGNSVFSR